MDERERDERDRLIARYPELSEADRLRLAATLLDQGQDLAAFLALDAVRQSMQARFKRATSW